MYYTFSEFCQFEKKIMPVNVIFLTFYTYILITYVGSCKNPLSYLTEPKKLYQHLKKNCNFYKYLKISPNIFKMSLGI